MLLCGRGRAIAAVILTILVLCDHAVERGAAVKCGSLRLQNELKDLSKLENCTIITGYLSLLLMEKATDEHDWDKYSFPNLIEIWEYLFVYRARRLTTLGNLFPNLRLIKGQETIHNHALVIWSMDSLQEIGLKNLRKIERGHVMIGNCEKLCYYKTIDWNLLGTELKTQNMSTDCEAMTCPAQCSDGHCWSNTECQRNSAITDAIDDCITEEGQCVEKCSKDRVLLAPGNLCIPIKECSQYRTNRQWFIYNQTCSNKCPDGYHFVNGTCKYCGSSCVHICDKQVVNALTSITGLKGCTHINGSLQFRVDEADVADELEKYLGGIKEIWGYLKVTRSPAIKSLEFLKNLQLIRGDVLDDKNNSLIVVDNRNLNKLWTFDSSFKLKIKRGKLKFHYNPQLRYRDIEKLNKLTINMEFTPVQVSKESNGDQRSELTLHTESIIHSTNATLSWEGYRNQSRGFFFYYIENEEILSGTEDACVSNAWNVVFTTNNSVTLMDLKPYANYSYYIVVTTASDKTQERTNTSTFMTLSGDPSGPRNVDAISFNATTIKLTWEPPADIRGILDKYVITYYKIPKDGETLKTRNYCTHPVHEGYAGIPLKEEANPMKNRGKLLPNGDCDCPIPYTSSMRRRDVNFETVEINFAHFDDQINEILKMNDRNGYLMENNDVGNISQPNFSEHLVSADQNSTLITNLDHFSTYVFYISACNENRTKDKQCSEIVMVYNRTSALANADDLSDFTIEGTKRGVVLNWTNPVAPNSAILSYTVHWKGETSSDLLCVLPTEGKYAGHVVHLLPGVYDIRVRAVTLAGAGNYTAIKNVYVGKPDSNDIGLIIGLLIAVTFFFVCGGFIFYQYRKRKELENMHLIQTVNPDYCGSSYVEDEWEIARDDVDIGSSLGKGTFGTVYCGYIKGRQMPCAVKTVNISSTYEEKMEFLNEASVMKSFSNAHHVVRLLGVVSKGEAPLVVMELMACGDLKTFLRRSRDSSQSIGCNEMYRMAIEIADGMAYLAAKKYVHRDLAARNCMVAGDHTIKIGDFGMARDIYETDYYRKESQGLLPVRWMAPESLSDGVFTTDSDIWSYGIVLWEMVTLAEQPYQGLGNTEVWEFVISKGRLSRPPECPDILYAIMEVCWRWQPNKRPQFADIVNRLESHVSEDFKVMSFYHSREGQEHRMTARDRPFNPPAMSQATRRNNNPFAHYHRSDENIGLYNDESDPINYPSNPNQRQNLLTDYVLEEDDIPGSNGYASLTKTP